jgi:hypothetical protein
VLAAFMAVNLTIQTLWISYAPISSTAQEYYGVSSAAIGALAISFMLAYLPFSFVASQLITHRGFRFAAGLGALLAGVSGVARGLVGPHYLLALLATVGAAIAQPFLLNAWTTCSTQWFPKSQRATAVSLITLANLFGVAVGMAVTPTLVESMSIAEVQLVYGVAALVAGIVFVVVARDRPPTPPELGRDAEPSPVLVGVRQAVAVRPFVVFLGVAFAAQLEAVRAGTPAPAAADPLMAALRSNVATAPGALSPNLESSHRSTLHAPRGPAGRAASAR